MEILSLEYLGFSAAVFLLYYLFPLRLRWLVLLAASLGFYSCSGFAGLAYLLSVSVITYGAALAADACEEKNAGRICALASAAVLGVMVLLKYMDALLRAFGAEPWNLIQPLGLSWFTFQTVGYVIDVSRKKAKPERNFLHYLLFVSFFPQMSQGPVSSIGQLAPQLKTGHRLEPVTVTMGFQLMLWGCFKKLVLADRLAPFTAYLTTDTPKPGYMIWLGAAVYLIRLYADFSGAIDLIRGTAMLFGVTMTANFRQPLFSASVAEFWRRWHISLGAWFRDYLLYPFTLSIFGKRLGRLGTRLLGKRNGRNLAPAVGTVLVFLLIGLWHGAYWNAALYGLYFGLLMGIAMLLEPTFKAWKKKWNIRDKAMWLQALRLLRTWTLLVIAQFFAFTTAPSQAFSLLGSCFSGWGISTAAEELLLIMNTTEWCIALGAGVLLLIVDILCDRGVNVNRRVAAMAFPLRWLLLLALILIILIFGCYGKGTASSAFVYTQF